MSVHGDHSSGAAKRRRDRRLRMRWRHEQLPLQMALTAALRHSRDVGPVTYNALRSQKTAKAGEWVQGALHGEDLEAPTPQEPGTQHFFLDDDSVPELGGVRPDRLFEVRPQERDHRRTVVQIVDNTLTVPSCAADGESTGADVPAAHIPELAIVVPKISPPSRHCRRCVRFAEQTAEQLMEVPTIISYSSLLQRIMEQTVDIPVPQGGGRHADLQGFLRGPSATGVEQIVDIPGGGLQDFRPGQSSSASSSSPAGVHEDADEPGEGFFSHFFPTQKKCEGHPGLECESAQGVEPIHAERSSNGSCRGV